jgi:hypothetical protein
MDLGDLIKVLFVLATIVWPLVQTLSERAKRKKAEQQAAPPPTPPSAQRRPTTPAASSPRPASARPVPPPRPPHGGSVPSGMRGRPGLAAPLDPYAEHRRRLAQSLEAISAEAKELGEQVRQERATERFVEVLTGWIPDACAKARADLSGSTGPISAEVARLPQQLLLVLREVQTLIAQRRDPHLLPVLGDADALAEACYAPVVQFAHREDLPLSTARPVVRLAEVDLAIWTGFAPTSLAPIFLPQGFLTNVLWWPAIAHEIGHDFLISVHGLSDGLRRELGLPSEEVGTRPLALQGDSLHPSELVRLHGGWFEELFCDVFGTLMCGPGYLSSMVELFASPDAPTLALTVGWDPKTGRLGHHPPRHLRVHVSAYVLERAGFARDARALRSHWNAKHGLVDDETVPLLVPAVGRYVRLPFVALRELAVGFAERLYSDRLQSLAGHCLQDISGLDYGPHKHQQGERAKRALLAGHVPSVRQVPAVIAGAVLATVEKPELAARILELARRAIIAVGTFEVREDAFNLPVPVAGSPGTRIQLELGARALQEALLLRELLDRPRGLSARGRSRAAARR